MPDRPRFFPARPTIAVDGQDRGTLSEGLLSLSVVENTQGLYRCEAVFGNWGPVQNRTDFLYFDRALLEFGKSLSVKLGDKSVFTGLITALEAHFPEGRPPELGVLAEDRLQELRMVRRTRTFDDMSDADVFTRIASDHGLSPSVDLAGPTHKVLAQVNQSDLAFLRDRARTVDAELWMDDRTLHARSHGSRAGSPLALGFGNELREFSVLADLAHQRTSVTVTGWDVTGKTGLRYEASAAAVRGELNGDAGGSSILSSAFGDRKDAIAHTVPLSSAEAQAEAEAYFRVAARRFVVGRGIAQPDARLRVGAAVTLEGLGPLFSGRYYLSEVHLSFDGSQGTRVEFTAERPGLSTGP